MNMAWDEYVNANMKVLQQVDESDIADLLSFLEGIRKVGGTLWILGNGGNASLASHASADFSKTVNGLGGLPLKSVALSDLVALQTAFSNDESFEDGFGRSLRLLAKPEDGVLLFSVSGTSPNLLAAVKTAKELGLRVGAVVGSGGANPSQKPDCLLVLASSDYQVVENAQVSIMHWLTKRLA
jgi:D-sedoheptulose 7-phosphate isomerase